jgi:ketosteroid isomerase-like protein
MTSAPAESANVAAALALVRALERGVHGEALRAFYTPDAISIEHPNRITPNGGSYDLDHIVAASDAGAALMQNQRYDIRDVVEAGDQVIFRYVWTGVVGVDRGPFRSGQKLIAHIAAFATVADGRIARFETYDCYEPFAS